MKIEVGQFGRFWSVERPTNPMDYIFGYLTEIGIDGRYRDEAGMISAHFEPAYQQPQWPTRRRVIKDRAKLCRVLLDMGYVPDDEGNFKRSCGLANFLFLPDMWSRCGKDVKWSHEYYIDAVGFSYHEEWTEEY